MNENSKDEKQTPIRQKLTEITIRNLAIPDTGQRMYLDDIVPSFGVRISAGGANTYIVQGRVRGGEHPARLKLGRVSAVTLIVARESARGSSPLDRESA
jgi:hypothetical protein